MDVVYGVINDTGSSATVGVENDSSRFVEYECDSGGISNGLQLVFQQSCTDGGGQCAPVANFVGGPLIGAVPLVVTFTNSSVNATSYLWSFGDGSSSTAFNPTNTYTNAGNYTVSLTAIGSGGSNTLTLTNYVVVTNQPPMFVVQPVSQVGGPGTNVTFMASATGTVPLAYQWQHNGTNIAGGSSTALVLTNIGFADAGNYTVTATNAGGSATSTVATLSVVYLSGFISVDGSPYLETFDEMGPAGTNAPYGWYVGAGTQALIPGLLSPSTGTSIFGRNYNFGSSGGMDRALGSVAASGSQRDTEARFVNVSGKWLTGINISCTGEQWRCGGAGSVTNSLVLQYSTDGTAFNNIGAQFNFNSPTVTTTASALDGNVSTNRVVGVGGFFCCPRL